MKWTSPETRLVFQDLRRDLLDAHNDLAASVRQALDVYGRRAWRFLARQLRRAYASYYGRDDGDFANGAIRLTLRRVHWTQVARRLVRVVAPTVKDLCAERRGLPS